MNAPAPDPTTLPWPLRLLRYVGSHERSVLIDLIWFLDGSPDVSQEEAEAIYELVLSFSGSGTATDDVYAAAFALVESGSPQSLAIELFRCSDTIQSDPTNYGLEPVHRGLELARALSHCGAEASFMSYHAGWYMAHDDNQSALRLTLEALDIYLGLADADEVYAHRVHQSAMNAVSLTARTGDWDRARELFAELANVIEPDVAEQIRQTLYNDDR